MLPQKLCAPDPIAWPAQSPAALPVPRPPARSPPDRSPPSRFQNSWPPTATSWARQYLCFRSALPPLAPLSRPFPQRDTDSPPPDRWAQFRVPPLASDLPHARAGITTRHVLSDAASLPAHPAFPAIR